MERSVSFLEVEMSSNPLLRPKDERREIGVKIKAKMDYLDDIAEEVHMDVSICLHYQDENARQYITGHPGFVPCDPETSNIYCPVLQFLHTRSCEHIEGFKLLVSTMTGIVYLFRVYRLAVREVFELQRFPFDRQVIKCTFQTYGGRFCRWDVPESDMPFGVRSDHLWKVHDCLAEYDQSIWIVDWVSSELNSEENPSFYKLSFGLSRTSTYYLTNFVLVTYFVVGSSLSCIAIDHSDFGSRASITYTLLLTVVALKFVMSSSIPRINYLTLFDIYNISGMLMIIAVILENFLVSLFFDDNEANGANFVDLVFATLFAILWSFFHATIVFGAYSGAFYMDWKRTIQEDQSTTHFQKVFKGLEHCHYHCQANHQEQDRGGLHANGKMLLRTTSRAN
jgi:hypothetical protein